MNTCINSSFKSASCMDGGEPHSCHYIKIIPEGKPKGIIQISHGMCEYIERYLPFAHFLADNGFIVCGNDHLGHGQTVNSDEELGYFSEKNGWQYAVEDLYKLTKIMKAEYPGLPYIMLGHSMGSFLARAYAVKHGSECCAYIFMGTADGFESAVGEAASKIKHSSMLTDKIPNACGILGKAALELMLTQGEIIGRIKGYQYRSKTLDKIAFGKNNERIENQRTRYDWLSRDEDEVEKYINDPKCTFTFTVNGFINLASALWYVSDDKWYSNVPKDIPILLIAGDADPIGNYGNGVKSVYNKLCDYRSDVSLVMYEGARHELLHETNKQEVYGDILSFILGCLDKED